MTATEIFWFSIVSAGYLIPALFGIPRLTSDRMDQVALGALWSFGYLFGAAAVGIVIYEMFYRI